MLTNISTKATRYPQIHRVINNLSLCMLLKKKRAIHPIRDSGNTKQGKCTKTKNKSLHGPENPYFWPEKLGMQYVAPPSPGGGIGLKPSETGSRWKSSKTWVIETKIIKAESRQKKADLHRSEPSRTLLSMVGEWGVGFPLSSVMLTLRVGMFFEWEF